MSEEKEKERKRWTDKEWKCRDPSAAKRMLAFAIKSVGAYNKRIENIPIPDRLGVKAERCFTVDTQRRNANCRFRDNMAILLQWNAALLHQPIPSRSIQMWLEENVILDKSYERGGMKLILAPGIVIFGTDSPHARWCEITNECRNYVAMDVADWFLKTC